MDFEDYCRHNDIDYSISYDELNFHPRGYVFMKPSGRYHIVLNGKHSVEQLKKTIMHELTHIKNNHLGCSKEEEGRIEIETCSMVNALYLLFEG